MWRTFALLAGKGPASSCSSHTVGMLASNLGCGQLAKLPSVSLALRRSMGSGVEGVAPEVLAKARKLSLGAGGLAGLFGAFVGVGGGVLISPLIAAACKTLPQRVISGTSLTAVMSVGSVSGLVYYNAGVVDTTSAAILASMATIMAPLGARATHAVDCRTLRLALGYWLFFVAPLIPIKKLIFERGNSISAPEATDSPVQPVSAPPVQLALAEARHENPGSSSPPAVPKFGRELRQEDWMIACVGAVAGFASGLLGIGGGTIVTPLLALLTGLPQQAVVGTSLFAMVLPSTVAVVQHQRLGNIDVRMALALVAGSAVGSAIGAHTALQTPPLVLELAFSGGIMWLAHKTLKAARAVAK